MDFLTKTKGGPYDCFAYYCFRACFYHCYLVCVYVSWPLVGTYFVYRYDCYVVRYLLAGEIVDCCLCLVFWYYPFYFSLCCMGLVMVYAYPSSFASTFRYRRSRDNTARRRRDDRSVRKKEYVTYIFYKSAPRYVPGVAFCFTRLWWLVSC